MKPQNQNAPRAAILAIGTELCLGQTTNRNAAWLGAHLHEAGLFAPWHRTVPDDRELIRRELADLCQSAEILIVTGGLGPTSDDFTRNCIAEFFSLDLEWNESAWGRLQKRLRERGVPVREIHRQECYFPQGAQTIANDRGTAEGFSLFVEGPGRLEAVFVLPGPPAEVASVFQNGVRPAMARWQNRLNPLIVKAWNCLGLVESEVAEKIEAAIPDCPFEKGYRVHVPYVEFKLSYSLDQEPLAAPWLKKVEQILGPWIALRDQEDAAQRWLRAVEWFPLPLPIHLDDQITQGRLPRRIFESPAGNPSLFERLSWHHNAPTDPKWIRLSLYPQSGDDRDLGLAAEARIEIRNSFKGQPYVRRQQFHPPNQNPVMSERRRQFIMEHALLFWAKELENY